MNGVTSHVISGFSDILSWGFKKIDSLLDLSVQKIIEISKKTVNIIEGEDSIQQPTYWKKALQSMIETDFSKNTSKVLKKESFEKRFKRYCLFVKKCATGEIPLNPLYTIDRICKNTEHVDSFFHVCTLIFLALPYCENQGDEIRLSLFKKIISILPKIEKNRLPALLVSFRMQLQNEEELVWWNGNIQDPLTKQGQAHLCTSIEQEAKKRWKQHLSSLNNTAHTHDKPSSPLKVFFLALLILSQVQKTLAVTEKYFNNTEFWLAAKQWNYTNGNFNVYSQLVEQNYCNATKSFCYAPNDLVPPNMTQIDRFSWNKINLNFLPSTSLTLSHNSFFLSFINFLGNFNINNTTIELSNWNIKNGSSLTFSGSSLNNLFFSLGSEGNSSFLFYSSALEGCGFKGYDNQEVSNIEFYDTMLSSTSLLGPKFSRVYANHTQFNSAHIDQIANAVFNHSSLNNVIFGEWKNGMIENTPIKNGEIQDSLSVQIKNAPIIELTIKGMGQLLDSSIENVAQLRLKRSVEPFQAYKTYPFVNCTFENIPHMEINLEKGNVYNFTLKNIALNGSWYNGKIGDLNSCNPSPSIFQIHEVFAESIVFNHVIGNCLLETISAKTAKQWFEKSGITFGKKVTFIGYKEGNPNLNIVMGVGFLLLTLTIVGCISICFEQCLKRKKHSIQLTNPIDN